MHFSDVFTVLNKLIRVSILPSVLCKKTISQLLLSTVTPFHKSVHVVFVWSASKMTSVITDSNLTLYVVFRKLWWETAEKNKGLLNLLNKVFDVTGYTVIFKRKLLYFVRAQITQNINLYNFYTIFKKFYLPFYTYQIWLCYKLVIIHFSSL